MPATPLDKYLEELDVLNAVGANTIIYAASDPTNESYQLAISILFTSPNLLGVPTATTPPGSDNSTRIATTAFVKGQLTGLQPANPLLTQVSNLGDPGVDQLVFWDDSAGTLAYMSLAPSLSITGTVLSVNTAALAGVVHTTGNETISGIKTFASPIVGTITGNISTSQVTGLDTALNTKQPIDNTLLALAGLNITPNTMIYGTGPDAFALSTLTPFMRTLLDDPDVTSAQATLGIVPGGTPPGGLPGQVQYNNNGVFGGFGSWNGSTLTVPGGFAGAGTNITGVVHTSGNESIDGIKTFTSPINGTITGSITTAQVINLDSLLANKQPLDQTLVAFAGTTISANTLVYGSGPDNFSTTPLTPFMRTLLDDPDQASARETLGITGTGGSGGAVGSPVVGGTPNCVLFVGPTGLMANSSNFTFNAPTGTLTLSSVHSEAELFFDAAGNPAVDTPFVWKRGGATVATINFWGYMILAGPLRATYLGLSASPFSLIEDAGIARVSAGVTKIISTYTGELGSLVVGAATNTSVPLKIQLHPNQANDAFEVLASDGTTKIASINSVGALTLPKLNNDSSLKVGAIELQSVQVGVGTVGENYYYDGVADRRRADGVASRLIFYMGAVQLQVALTGAAGSSISWITGLVIDPSGATVNNLTVGGTLTVSGGISGSGANLTGVVHTTGNENITGIKSFRIPTSPTNTPTTAFEIVLDNGTPAMRFTANYDPAGTSSFSHIEFFNVKANALHGSIGFDDLSAGVSIAGGLMSHGASYFNAMVSVGALADLSLSGRVTTFAGQDLIIQPEAGKETRVVASSPSSVPLTVVLGANQTADAFRVVKSDGITKLTTIDKNGALFISPGLFFDETTPVFKVTSGLTGAGVGFDLLTIPASGYASFKHYNGATWLSYNGTYGVVQISDIWMTGNKSIAFVSNIDLNVIRGNDYYNHQLAMNYGGVGGIFSVTDPSEVVFAVKAAVGQTANIQEWRNSGGTPLAWIDNLGKYHGDASLLTATTLPLGTSDTHLATTEFVIQNVVPGPQGPQGPPGAANARYTNDWIWRNVSGDPGNGRVATDLNDWPTATQMFLSDLTADGFDFPGHEVKVGDDIHIQEKSDGNNWAQYDVVGVTDFGTYMRYDIAYIDSGGMPTPSVNTRMAITLLTQGVTASYWYNGVGVPDPATGRDGDYYLNDANGDVYAMSGGSWVLVTNIKGEMMIGSPIIGGTANRVLFTGPTGLAADSSKLTYNGELLAVEGTTVGSWVSLQEWRRPGGQAAASINNNGDFWGGNATLTGNLYINPVNAMIEFSGAGNKIIRDATTGRIDFFNQGYGPAAWRFVSNAVDCALLQVQATPGQQAHLQDWQNSSGFPLAWVDKDGKYFGDASGVTAATLPSTTSDNHIATTAFVQAMVVAASGGTNLVHTSGDEIVGGVKTFTDTIVSDGGGGTPANPAIWIQNNVTTDPIIRSEPTNSGYILQFYSGITPILRLHSNGWISAAGFFTDAGLYIRDFYIQRGGGGPKISFGEASTPAFTFGTADVGVYSTMALITVNTATSRGLTIKGADYQTANLLELKNSADLTLSKVDKDGNVIAPQFFTSGSNANYTSVRRDTQANAWQMGSQAGELFFWDYATTSTALAIMPGSHDMNYWGGIFNINSVSGSPELRFNHGVSNSWRFFENNGNFVFQGTTDNWGGGVTYFFALPNGSFIFPNNLNVQGTLTIDALAGLLKGTGGVVSAATAGIDYLAPGGSGAGITGVVHTTGDESIYGVKRFATRLDYLVDTPGWVTMSIGLSAGNACFFQYYTPSSDFVIDNRYGPTTIRGTAVQWQLGSATETKMALDGNGDLIFYNTTSAGDRQQARIAPSWADPTDNIRRAKLDLLVSDANGERTGLTIETNGVNTTTSTMGWFSVGTSTPTGVGSGTGVPFNIQSGALGFSFGDFGQGAAMSDGTATSLWLTAAGFGVAYGTLTGHPVTFRVGNIVRMTLEANGNVTIPGTLTLDTLTGLLKGTAGLVSVATAGVDYLAPGSSGAALTGVVHTTGNETIDGQKDFIQRLVVLNRSAEQYIALLSTGNSHINIDTGSVIGKFQNIEGAGYSSIGTESNHAFHIIQNNAAVVRFPTVGDSRMIVYGVSDTASFINTSFRSNTSGYGSFLHFSDTYSYNYSFGTAPNGNLEFWPGRFPGATGTIAASFNQNGSASFSRASSDSVPTMNVSASYNGVGQSGNAIIGAVHFDPTADQNTGAHYAITGSFIKNGTHNVNGWPQGALWASGNVNAGLCDLDLVVARAEVASGASSNNINHFKADTAYSSAGSTVGIRRGFVVADFNATCSLQIGFCVNQLTSGATNWGIYTEGNTPSRFGGRLEVGGTLKVESLTQAIPFANAAGLLSELAIGSGLSLDPSGILSATASTGGSLPGGLDGSVQYNNAGALGGFGNWNGTALTIPRLDITTTGTNTPLNITGSSTSPTQSLGMVSFYNTSSDTGSKQLVAIQGANSGTSKNLGQLNFLVKTTATDTNPSVVGFFDSMGRLEVHGGVDVISNTISTLRLFLNSPGAPLVQAVSGDLGGVSVKMQALYNTNAVVGTESNHDLGIITNNTVVAKFLKNATFAVGNSSGATIASLGPRANKINLEFSDGTAFYDSYAGHVFRDSGTVNALKVVPGLIQAMGINTTTFEVRGIITVANTVISNVDFVSSGTQTGTSRMGVVQVATGSTRNNAEMRFLLKKGDTDPNPTLVATINSAGVLVVPGGFSGPMPAPTGVVLTTTDQNIAGTKTFAGASAPVTTRWSWDGNTYFSNITATFHGTVVSANLLEFNVCNTTATGSIKALKLRGDGAVVLGGPLAGPVRIWGNNETDGSFGGIMFNHNFDGGFKTSLDPYFYGSNATLNSLTINVSDGTTTGQVQVAQFRGNKVTEFGGKVITGPAAGDSNFQAGRIEIESVAPSNAWIAENAYYDGGAWRFRADGVANQIYFIGGHIRFTRAASGLAGGVPAWQTSMDITETGDVFLSGALNVAGAISGSGANLTGVVHTTGNEIIGGVKEFTSPVLVSGDSVRVLAPGNPYVYISSGAVASKLQNLDGGGYAQVGTESNHDFAIITNNVITGFFQTSGVFSLNNFGIVLDPDHVFNHPNIVIDSGNVRSLWQNLEGNDFSRIGNQSDHQFHLFQNNVSRVVLGVVSAAQPPMTVQGRTDATTGIVASLASGATSSATMLHFSDTLTYNYAIGTGGGGDLEFWSGRYPGVAGVITAKFTQAGYTTFYGPGGDATVEVSGTVPNMGTGVAQVVFANRGSTTGTQRTAVIQAVTGVSKDIGQLHFSVKKNSADVNTTQVGLFTEAGDFIVSNGNFYCNGQGAVLATSYIAYGEYHVYRRDNRTAAWTIYSQYGDLGIYNDSKAADAISVSMATSDTTFAGKATAPKFIATNTITDFGFQVGSLGMQGYGTNNCWVSDNVYHDGINWTYKGNGYGTQLYFLNGTFQVHLAGNNTAGAGAVASMSHKFTVDGGGIYTPGTATVGALTVNGPASANTAWFKGDSTGNLQTVLKLGTFYEGAVWAAWEVLTDDAGGDIIDFQSDRWSADVRITHASLSGKMQGIQLWSGADSDSYIMLYNGSGVAQSFIKASTQSLLVGGAELRGNSIFGDYSSTNELRGLLNFQGVARFRNQATFIGNQGYQVWTDEVPSDGGSFGMAIPGGTLDHLLHICTFNGAAWSDRMTFNTATGVITTNGVFNVNPRVDTPEIRFNQDASIGWRFAKGGDGKLYFQTTNDGWASAVANTFVVNSDGSLQLGSVSYNNTTFSGTSNFVNGDDTNTISKAQIAFGYGGTPTHRHWIETQHNVSPDGNRMRFYTSDGAAGGVFPTNAILGLTIENGRIETPRLKVVTNTTDSTIQIISASPSAYMGTGVVLFENSAVTQGTSRVASISSTLGSSQNVGRLWFNIKRGATDANLTTVGEFNEYGLFVTYYSMAIYSGSDNDQNLTVNSPGTPFVSVMSTGSGARVTLRAVGNSFGQIGTDTNHPFHVYVNGVTVVTFGTGSNIDFLVSTYFNSMAYFKAQVLAIGNNGYQVYDAASPNTAVAFGVAVPGQGITSDLVLSTWSASIGWVSRLQINSLNGNVSVGANFNANNISALGAIDAQFYNTKGGAGGYNVNRRDNSVQSWVMYSQGGHLQFFNYNTGSDAAYFDKDDNGLVLYGGLISIQKGPSIVWMRTAGVSNQIFQIGAMNATTTAAFYGVGGISPNLGSATYWDSTGNTIFYDKDQIEYGRFRAGGGLTLTHTTAGNNDTLIVNNTTTGANVDSNAIYAHTIRNPSATQSIGTSFAISGNYTKTGPNNIAGYFQGALWGYANVAQGNVDYLALVASRADVLAGCTVATYYNFHADTSYSSAGTIGKRVGFHVGDLSYACTSQYGVYVENLGAGASNYAFWSEGAAPAVFGGKIIAANAGSGNNSSIQAGPIEIQGYGLDNCWIAENAFFNGGAWQLRNTGSAKQIYFTGGGIVFFIAASGAAGTSPAWVSRMTIGNDGIVTVPGNISVGTNLGVGGRMDVSGEAHLNNTNNFFGNAGNGAQLWSAGAHGNSWWFEYPGDNSMYWDSYNSYFFRNTAGGGHLLELLNGEGTNVKRKLRIKGASTPSPAPLLELYDESTAVNALEINYRTPFSVPSVDIGGGNTGNWLRIYPTTGMTDNVGRVDIGGDSIFFQSTINYFSGYVDFRAGVHIISTGSFTADIYNLNWGTAGGCRIISQAARANTIYIEHTDGASYYDAYAGHNFRNTAGVVGLVVNPALTEVRGNLSVNNTPAVDSAASLDIYGSVSAQNARMGRINFRNATNTLGNQVSASIEAMTPAANVGGLVINVKMSPSGNPVPVAYFDNTGCLRLASVAGTLLTGTHTTANRPTSQPVGAQWYDSTLKKPIWWDGGNWKDAMGNIV